MNWLPIFKTGSHIDSKGRSYDATREKLDQIATANSGIDVPFAIGHPKDTSPAYGWANEFKRVGEILYAKPFQVLPEFEAWVRKGLWKKISPSIRSDGKLNHIGFLGAQAPAIEGLTAEFGATDSAMAFEFSAADMSVVAAPDASASAASGISDPAQDKKEGGTMDKDETVEGLSSKLKQEQERTAQLETQLKAERLAKQRSEFSAFLDTDAMKTRITPAMRPSILGLMEFMASADAFEFSAADGQTVKKSPIDVFKTEILSRLAVQVDTQEFARHDTAGAKPTELDSVVDGIAAASPAKQ